MAKWHIGIVLLSIIFWVSSEAGAMMQKFDKGYALVIGTSTHADRTIRDIEQAANDARDIATVLTNPILSAYQTEKVRLLVNDKATVDNIKEGIKWLKESADKDSTVIFFFSGHGYSMGKRQFGLVAYDFDPTNESKILDSEYLNNVLNEIPSKKIVVILDCCHAGGVYSPGITPKGLKSYEKFAPSTAVKMLSSGEGTVAISSCDDNQSSYAFDDQKNSIFTLFLIKALTGEGRAIRNGIITIFEVFNYVSVKVPWYTHQKGVIQEPIFKTSGIKNNFPIAMNLLETSENVQTTMYMDGFEVAKNCQNTAWTTLSYNTIMPKINLLYVHLFFEPSGFGDIVKGNIRASELDDPIEFNTIANNMIPIPIRINKDFVFQYQITKIGESGKGVNVKIKGYTWLR